MLKKKVRLFFRKPGFVNNFSIEASFQEMMKAFPGDSTVEIEPVVVHTYSSGVVPRLQMMWDVILKQGAVNHISGDIHFVALGLPGRKTILTIHDCGFMRHPSPWVRAILKWLWLKFPVWHCKYVTAVSEATRQEIIQYTGCVPEKIRVIPTIIKQHFSPVIQPFNANCPTILHVGVTQNKNLERHIQALAGIPCLLHIIGRISDEEQALLKEYRIEYTCAWNISDAEVRQAYEMCDVLLFASTLEGFGMPILEAQTVGRPVVTSNISSMPEVAGQGACLVDPYDVQSIRNGVLRVIEDTAYRNQLVQYGFANVKRFEPDAVAEAYEALYLEVLGMH